MATILITGTNRGLGLEFARQYAEQGWNVIATSRKVANSGALTELANTKKNLSVKSLDVASEESTRRLAQELKGVPIDVLVLNSAVYTRVGNTLGELNYEGWRQSFETNVLGAVRVAEALLENVAASKKKQIVAISSGMGSVGDLGKTIGAGAAYQYRTTKTALNMAMAILAKEVEPRGIAVVVISPGWVQTDMGGANAALTPEQSISGMRKVLSGDPKGLSGKFWSYDGTTWAW